MPIKVRHLYSLSLMWFVKMSLDVKMFYSTMNKDLKMDDGDTLR